MYCFKIHETKDGKVIAVCDEYLVGSYLFDNNYSIISEGFYGNKKINEDEFIKLLEENMHKMNSINIMGKNSVDVAKKIFEDMEIIKVGDKEIPHSILIF
ncbi:MAG: DUF424 family protein [Candidatus Nanoarchaeia archaeon]|nr:DUF424 family protein [Candidatus Nanoarchaeia archaeon]